MALSKIALRKIVQQAIQQLPTTVKIKRKHLNDFGEEDGTYDDIVTLTGVLYKNDSSPSNFYAMNQGNNYTKGLDITFFLTDWNIDSTLVKDLDVLITVDNDINKVYDIQDTGENMEIYHNMQLSKSTLTPNDIGE